MIGLYAITHTASRKSYIGSSTDIKRRIKEHKTDLKYNKHHCTHLQNSWNKYGQQAFEIKIIAEAFDLNEARELEQAFLDCFFKSLLNSKPSAIGAAWGEDSHAKRPDWHMKTVMQRLTPEERRARYGKAKGTKRGGLPYVAGAAKRLADPEFRAKLSEACKGKREVVQCPHCGLQGGGGNMHRYHFDKCGKKP
jgi:group I intron endonuclease